MLKLKLKASSSKQTYSSWSKIPHSQQEIQVRMEDCPVLSNVKTSARKNLAIDGRKPSSFAAIFQRLYYMVVLKHWINILIIFQQHFLQGSFRMTQPPKRTIFWGRSISSKLQFNTFAWFDFPKMGYTP